jgi:amino acid adenylation domain-containing protein
VDRRALPAPDSARPDLEAGFSAPRTEAERLLAEIWRDLLGVEAIGIHDDFFQLGGHSLLVAKLAARVRQAFKVELSLVEVFKRPTVASLAEAVEKAEMAALDLPELPPVKRAPRDRPIPLSFPQERVWFLNQLSRGGRLAYNFQASLLLHGALDAACLNAAFTELVRRHESLRTTFPTLHGKPVQIVHPPMPVAVPLVDLTGLPEDPRRAEAERLIFEATQTPFDPEVLPLIRWRLLKLDPELWRLIQVEHHYVHDGWSLAVLLRETKALYEAFERGEPSPLPELPVQFADFAVWQREWMASPAMDRLLAYWKGKLAGCPTALDLPTDKPRPAEPTFRGDLQFSYLPPTLYSALRAFGRAKGYTLFMTTLAGFFAVLARTTGQQDLLVGTGHANRRTKELEGLIGMIVNTLVLRGDLSGNPTVEELLDRTRATTLECYTYQDMPFERLVAELQPERHLGRNPLFQVMFAFHDSAIPDLRFGAVKGELHIHGNRSAKMDLNVVVVPRAEQRVGRAASEEDLRCLVQWEYSTDLFEPATMERMRARYLRLLEAVVEHPELRLADLPLATAEERRQLLYGWNETATAYPREAAIHQLVAAQAERRPGATAVAASGFALTYGELRQRAEQLARRLAGQGVGPGSRVVLLAERSVDAVVASLAILMAGGAYVPLDPNDPAERLRFVTADAGASAVVVSRGLPEGLGGLAVPTISLADPQGPEAELPAGLDADCLAYVIYTSGSTGRPKGVAVPHRAVARLVCDTNYVEIRPGDRIAHLSNVAFDAAMFEVWGALANGATVVVIPRETALAPARVAAELAGGNVTSMFVTTALFNLLVREAPGCFAEVRDVLFGGEAVDPGAVRACLAAGPPRRLLHVYGPTESATFTTWHEVSGGDVGWTVPIGQPLANTTVYVLDRWGAPAPLGVPGELLIGGDGLALGYHARPELTAERFVPDPWGAAGSRLYRTGDLVRRSASGAIEFLGRIDTQVKLRGFRVELGEIEAALCLHPEVAAAAVVVHESEPGDRRLVGYLVPAGAAVDLGAVRDFLRRRLPEYMVPAAFMVLPALPLNPNGKVDRKALPAPEAAVRAAAEYVAPRTPVEELLAGLWAEMLDVDRVGIKDDFFALGGHSLSAIRVLSRVRDAFGVDVRLAVVFEERTVEAMGAAIDERLAAGPAPAAVGRHDALLTQAAALPDADLDALLSEMIGQGGRR